MKAADLTVGSRVVYGGLPGRRTRKGVLTGLASSGRGLRARLLLDDGTGVVCPLNLVSPLAGTNGDAVASSCVRCATCRRVCGAEWHTTDERARLAAWESGWREVAPGLSVCPECGGRA